MYKYLLPILLLIAGWAGIAASSRDDSDSERASYYFMESESRKQQEQGGTAYYMMRRAHRLDPSDLAVAADLALLDLGYTRPDSSALEDIFRSLRQLFFSNTSDFDNGEFFAQMAGYFNRHDDVRDAYRALMLAHPGRSEYALEYAKARATDFLRGDSSAIADALGVMDSLEAVRGVQPIFVYTRIRMIAMSGDTARMVSEISRLPRLQPDDSRFSSVAGSLFASVNRLDSAKVYFDRAVQLDSTDGDALLGRTNYYLAIGDSATYNREVEHVLNNDNIEFESKLDLLADYTRALYKDSGTRRQVESLFEHMLEIHPGEAPLHHLYGAYLATMDDPAAACEQFGFAMDLDPTDEDYPHMRMSTALQAGDTATAIEAMRAAAARIHNPMFNVSGSALLDISGDSKGALALLDSYEISDADNPRAISVLLQQRGDLLYKLELLDSALTSYERSIKLDPTNAGSLNNLAYFLADNDRDIDRAEGYALRAVKSEPDNPTYVDTYAWVLYKLGDYDGARRRIDDALALYKPGDTVALETDTIMFAEELTAVENDHDPTLVRNREAFENSEIDESEALVEVAEEATGEPISKDILDHAGDIYFMCGETDRAVEFWQKALEIDPKDKRIEKKVKSRKIAPPNVKKTPK